MEPEEQDNQILPLPAQADFFDDGSEGVALASLDKPDATKRYTGVELERRVAVRDAVVNLLAQGVGIQRICRAMRAQGVQIGEHSVMALMQRRPDLVAMAKKQLSEQLGRIVKLAADSIEQRLIEGKFKPGSVDLAVFIDKKASVDGEASMVIEHRHTLAASAEDFRRRLEDMKRAKVVELSPAKELEAAVNDPKPQ